MASASSSYY